MIDKRPLVLYHARCVDGAGAAFAAWCRFGEEAEYRAVLHGDPAPTDEEVRDRNVYVLDFAYSKEDSDRIWRARAGDPANMLPLFFTIDHHVTTAEILGKPPYLILDTEHSGAVLAWKYFHGAAARVPLLISYIEDKDLWRWKMDRSREVSAALEARGVRTDFRVLVSFFSADKFFYDDSKFSPELQFGYSEMNRIHDLRQEGVAVLRAQNQYVDAIVSVAERVKFYADQTNSLWIYAASAPILQSEVGEALAVKSRNSGEAPVGVVWFRDGSRGNYRVSLRSVDGYDVSRIAKLFPGGGGHRAAAGFECEKLPW